MRTVVPFPILIPYGVERWSPDAVRIVRFGDGRAELDAAVPLAVAPPGPGGLIRLNACGADLPPLAPGDPAGLAQRLEGALARMTGAWNAQGVRFVAGWFAALNRAVAEARPDLAARLAPFEGLYAPEDFIFSGPAPLPRAFLYAPDSGGGAPEADFVQVDFAAWLGGRPLALLAAQSALTPGAARRRRDRLGAAGIEIVSYTAADIADPEGRFFAGLLARLDVPFHVSETLPAAPGGPTLPLF
ncbi:hypothetical protein [Methylobrevis albus]|uniref:Uncharacterized protein n=1 Tax=Methylobrevis albus TaxID=2793297 RepID=A0A931I1S1_9HYPH|nr:hypothetical protein [Methylobrevis albus]MBH0237710.1 hypothetical protein [Methylobrevis albus]